MSGFGATCENCLRVVQLTDEQAARRIGPDGEFQCWRCKIQTRPRRPRRKPDNWGRENGCIVTVRTRDDQIYSVHRDGKVFEALRQIIGQLEDGDRILSISTENSILSDLNRVPGLPGTADQYATERSVLSRIGRLDLLEDA